MKRIFCKWIVVLMAAMIGCSWNMVLAAEDEVQERDEGWRLDGDNWWYRNADGTYPTDCWQLIDGAYYYFDEEGDMQTGWIYDDAWYYLNPDGTMAVGWMYDGYDWYYMNIWGTIYTGWLFYNGSWYYLNPDGTMHTGWLLYDDAWYYLSDDGVMMTGWILDGAAWYYMDGNGVMTSGWQQYQGNWYYLSPYGFMMTGWIWDGSAWYYLYESGIMATGWLQDGGDTYYLGENGAMVTGRQTIDGKTYVFEDNGALKTQMAGPDGLQAKDLIGLSKEEIIELLAPLFIEDQRRTGILASVSMGQFMLESDTGRSELAQNANNLFGMKYNLSGDNWPGSAWDGVSGYTKETKEQEPDGTYITVKATFRKYDCIEDSIADHSAYLLGAKKGDRLRYEGIQGCTDYRKAAQIIINGGYATSQTYVDTLCSIIEGRNLTQYDLK